MISTITKLLDRVGDSLDGVAKDLFPFYAGSNWKWHGNSTPPSVQDIKHNLVGLLGHIWDEVNKAGDSADIQVNIESGGIAMSFDYLDDHPELKISWQPAITFYPDGAAWATPGMRVPIGWEKLGNEISDKPGTWHEFSTEDKALWFLDRIASRVDKKERDHLIEEARVWNKSTSIDWDEEEGEEE